MHDQNHESEINSYVKQEKLRFLLSLSQSTKNKDKQEIRKGLIQTIDGFDCISKYTSKMPSTYININQDVFHCYY